MDDSKFIEMVAKFLSCHSPDYLVARTLSTLVSYPVLF
jgi:hypothetical protein